MLLRGSTMQSAISWEIQFFESKSKSDRRSTKTVQHFQKSLLILLKNDLNQGIYNKQNETVVFNSIEDKRKKEKTEN